MSDLTAAFAHVIATLDRHRIEHILVGSVAASPWGLTRATIDIDLVIMVGDIAGESLIAELCEPGYYVPPTTSIEAIRGTGPFNLLDPSTGAKIDIFVCAADDEFESMRMERRVRVEVIGIETDVPTPEDLILAKLRWRSATGSETQWRDCIELASMNRLDAAHLRDWGSRLGIADAVEELLASIPD